jgi:hypothetical protein
VVSLQLPFHQLGQLEPMTLQMLGSGQTLPFSVRTDEVVTDLRLRLQINPGAEVLRGSQLKVLLNDEPVALLPIDAGSQDALLTRELALDARLLTDYNRLQLQLLGPRERVCDRLDRQRLAVAIQPMSSLLMTVERLPLANDLGLLPAPFFDLRDNRRLALGLLLPPQHSPAVLHSAGVLASWFGALAAYRGAELRSVLDADALPPHHAVVLATPANQPRGVLLPEITGPTVAMTDHPNQPNSKLLLVLGRDDAELRRATEALVLGQLDRQGPIGVPTGAPLPPPRLPYDAPTWLPTHKPVRFGDMPGVSAATLRSRGAHPEPVRIEFRLPPDLHFTRQDTVPLELRWHHSAVPAADRSALRLSLNGAQLRQFRLSSSLGLLDLPKSWFGAPAVGQMQRERDSLAVAGGLFARQPANLLGLRFDYDVPVDDPCHPQAQGQQVSEIDPASTLDFSEVPHFIGLPDLTVFANGGFPYSRLADLSGSAVLLPSEPDRSEIDTYLALMSHLGRSTGTPAIGLQVGTAADLDRLGGRDLLLLGSPGRQPLLRRWAAHLPLPLDDAGRTGDSAADTPRLVRPPGQRPRQDDWGGRAMLDIDAAWQATRSELRRLLGDRQQRGMPVLGERGSAALIGFESPLTRGRSVVALTASQPDAMAGLVDALLTPALLGRIHGQVTLVEQGRVRSFDDGPSYYSGDVNLYLRLRFMFARHPVGLALLLSLVALALGVASASALRRVAQSRLVMQDGGHHQAAGPAAPALHPQAIAPAAPETSVPPQ